MDTRSRYFAYFVRSNEAEFRRYVAIALVNGAEIYEEKMDCTYYHILVRFKLPLTITQARNKLGRTGDTSFCTVKKPDEYRCWMRTIGKRVFIK